MSHAFACFYTKKIRVLNILLLCAVCTRTQFKSFNYNIASEQNRRVVHISYIFFSYFNVHKTLFRFRGKLKIIIIIKMLLCSKITNYCVIRYEM